jgi:YVTN family beta-propeller protein
MPRTLTVINTATNTVVTTIAVGWKPIGVCVNGDGSRVYVTNNIDNTVSVINTATNTVLSTIPVGTDPLGASVTADGSRLYIANKGSNNVSVINTATNSVVATIPVGTAPVSMGNFMATISSNCASAPITFTMTVNPTTIPTLSIGITAGNQTICAGTSVTFTATPTNAGVTPTYQWKKNGTAISGATNSTYTSTTLANNDIIQCVVSNNATCNSTATSNSVTMTVTPSVTPTVLVSVTAGSQTTCAGASVTFTATPTHGGATPTYQWQLNNAPIGGATNATYTSASLANNDIIRCILTSNATCATATTATSNALTLTVNALLTPSVVVAITAGSASVCAGTNVTFTATPTNGGANPTYQWQKNGAAISGATNGTYTSESLANNDRIHCILTSNATCLAAATATSNHTMMTIYAKPVVNFTYTIVGGVVTFTNASTAGTTHWNFGDANNSTAVLSNPSFTYTANGSYQVSLEVTSANNCATKLTQTVNVTRVGIHDFAEVLKINVLPNPFSEWLTITMEQTDFLWDEPYQIMVTNSIGQTVYQSVLKAKRMQVNTQSWSDGIYNISLYAKGQVIPLKKGIKIAR